MPEVILRNDASMFEENTWNCRMGNAGEELKEQADYITARIMMG